MILRKSLPAAALAALIGLGTAVPAAAHGSGMAQPYHQGWHQGWHLSPRAMDPGTPHGGMMHPGMMYGCPMAGGYGAPGYGGMHRGMMMGPSMMGPGMMGPGMMGPGPRGQDMMGPGTGSGMGPGSRGGMMMQPDSAAVSVEDVTRMLERRLAWQGNPHVKLGKVEAQDDNTIVAEIVTQDGSLVERLEVDRRSGWMRMAP